MFQRYKFTIFVALGALCLMLNAFYNGFPIVYSDTSTYLASGFELETPVDRPITYGLLMRLTSLNGLSLWLTIFCQSLLLSYLICLFIRQFTGEPFFSKFGLIILLSISLFTGISWTSSELIADIFSPIAILSLVLILFGSFKKSSHIFLFILYFIAIATHLSHFVIFSLLLIMCLLARKLLFENSELPKLYRTAAILFVLTLGAIFTMGSALSKSKDVFMMGAMVEQGITKQYLDEYCGKTNYNLCRYKDSLPKTFNEFVWDTNSVFYKSGGWSEKNRKEYNDIIMSTFTRPKYVALHILASAKATLHQLVSFHIADGNGTFTEGTLLYSRIIKYAHNDAVVYKNSRQNKNEFLAMPNLNMAYDVIILLSVLCLLAAMALFGKRIEKQFKSITYIIIAAIFLCAWDEGTFSCVANRFGCKMMWLFLLLAIIAIYKGTKKEESGKA